MAEREIPLSEFPSPESLWQRWKEQSNLNESQEEIVLEDYYTDDTGKAPRYYQLTAINRTLSAVAAGQRRLLLVMATGTGKTFTAFQIIWRLWKSRTVKRVLVRPFGGTREGILNAIRELENALYDDETAA